MDDALMFCYLILVGDEGWLSGQRAYRPAPLLAGLLAHPLCQWLYLSGIGFYLLARLHRRPPIALFSSPKMQRAYQ